MPLGMRRTYLEWYRTVDQHPSSNSVHSSGPFVLRYNTAEQTQAHLASTLLLVLLANRQPHERGSRCGFPDTRSTSAVPLPSSPVIRDLVGLLWR
jgi:hypothetical protein